MSLSSLLTELLVLLSSVADGVGVGARGVRVGVRGVGVGVSASAVTPVPLAKVGDTT